MKIDYLWAPWRLEYIKGDKSGGCPFCELPKEGPKEENLVLYTDEDFFVILNKFPYNPGHLLVIPREHVAYPTELNAAAWQRCSLGLRAAVEVLKEAYEPQGFNMGMNLGSVGGAGIPGHLHWHLLPRWGGDTNFMPLLAETKAIPTHNLTVYQTLKPFFADFATRLDKK